MRPGFFLLCKITGTSDSSFTMAQLQKCNSLLQGADKSSYVEVNAWVVNGAHEPVKNSCLFSILGSVLYGKFAFFR